MMDFGEAIRCLKDGDAVARKGWRGYGKGMFLYYVGPNSYPAQTKVARYLIGEQVPYLGYIAMKTATGQVVPWLASQTDVLSEDWESVYQGGPEDALHS